MDNIFTFFENLNNFLTSSEFLFFVGILKFIAVFLILILLIRIIILVMKSGYFNGVKKRYSWYFPGDMTPPRQRKKEIWQKIKNNFYKSNRGNNNLFAIDADDFLISVFLDLGLYGETLEDQLQQLGPSKLRNTSEVMRAHTLIAGLRSGEDSFLSYDDAERIIFIYEEALKGLGIIDNL